MIDYFALLRQPRKPWLDSENLKEQYQQLTLSEHPDLQSDGRAEAVPTFAAITEGYRILNNPRLRLKHLLTLEGNAPAPSATVPAEVTDLFSETGAIVRDILDDLVDATVRERNDLAVADAALNQRTVEHRLAKPRGQIVQHDHALATGAQLQNDVTTDVARTAGD